MKIIASENASGRITMHQHRCKPCVMRNATARGLRADETPLVTSSADALELPRAHRCKASGTESRAAPHGAGGPAIAAVRQAKSPAFRPARQDCIDVPKTGVLGEVGGRLRQRGTKRIMRENGSAFR